MFHSSTSSDAGVARDLVVSTRVVLYLTPMLFVPYPFQLQVSRTMCAPYHCSYFPLVVPLCQKSSHSAVGTETVISRVLIDFALHLP